MAQTKFAQGEPQAIVIAGCGYTGTRIAEKLRSDQKRLIALTATTQIQIQGVESLQIDFDSSKRTVDSAGDMACVIYLVPPPTDGIRDTRIRNFFDRILHEIPKRLVLISTTGVYGDCQGAWIDEDTPVNPQTDRARRRLDAEQFATDWAKQNDVSLAILRVGAIYGPNRVPRDRIRRGITLPPASESGFLNRIHVDDLTAICIAAAHSDSDGIFNVSDGHPMKMVEYMNLVAEIWSLPKIKVSSDSADLESNSHAMRQYLSESRRIDNNRVLREFSVELRYPTAKQGLEASFSEMERTHTR